MITRIRRTPGGVDQYGDPVPSNTIETELRGAFVAPRMSDEIQTRSRAGVAVGLTLFAPAGTDLRFTDQVRVDGEVFEVDGEVARWEHPGSGWAPGITAALKRAQG